MKTITPAYTENLTDPRQTWSLAPVDAGQADPVPQTRRPDAQIVGLADPDRILLDRDDMAQDHPELIVAHVHAASVDEQLLPPPAQSSPSSHGGGAIHPCCTARAMPCTWLAAPRRSHIFSIRRYMPRVEVLLRSASSSTGS